MLTKCFSSHVDPCSMNLFIPSLSIFSFFFPSVLSLNFSSSVPTYHMLHSSWSYHQTEIQAPMVSTYFLLCQHTWPTGSQSLTRPSVHSPGKCPAYLSDVYPVHLPDKGVITFSVMGSTYWNGRNWHHDWTFISFLWQGIIAISTMEHWCFMYYGLCKKVVQRLLQPSEVHAKPPTVIHRTEFMASCCRDTDTCNFRRHLLTAAILSCIYLRMTCLMDSLERCIHTQTKHEMAIVKHSW